MELPKTLSVNGAQYSILKLLGKGKGGYSYLAEREGKRFTLKQIHHEPCDYYTLGDKLQSELRDYNTLHSLGIKLPELYEVDVANERILKEYIDGDTIAQIVDRDGRAPKDAFVQVREMCSLLYANGLNIDYYPTNYILSDGTLYYIDYECNRYSDEWNFENWGMNYWSKL